MRVDYKGENQEALQVRVIINRKNRAPWILNKSGGVAYWGFMAETFMLTAALKVSAASFRVIFSSFNI